MPFLIMYILYILIIIALIVEKDLHACSLSYTYWPWNKMASQYVSKPIMQYWLWVSDDNRYTLQSPYCSYIENRKCMDWLMSDLQIVVVIIGGEKIDITAYTICFVFFHNATFMPTWTILESISLFKYYTFLILG